MSRNDPTPNLKTFDWANAEYIARVLPGDSHVHSEWSWDAPRGDMERTAARAVELGVPAVAFTEHADWTHWNMHGATVQKGTSASVVDDVLIARPLEVDGYLGCIRLCRERFPQLQILSGVELSEPHLHPAETARLLASGDFDRVLGSVHTLLDLSRQGRVEVTVAYRQRPALDVVRGYLDEARQLAASDAPFAVLAHLDYPLRRPEYWREGPFDWLMVEGEARAVLEALAGSGRALEVNTRTPVPVTLLKWWHEAGGGAVSFGSDAHEPGRVARDFAAAAGLAEMCGYRSGDRLGDLWGRA